MVALEVLFIVGVANGAPILAENLLQDRCKTPVDFGLRLFDGRPLFGRSKTWRGLLAALAAAVVGAVAFGLSPETGVWLGVGAMSGDLLSSFAKRRLGIPPSGMALGLDQIPEVLIPLLLVRSELALQAREVIALTALFIVIELLLSRVLFRLHIRKRPY
jgi:CDP-2,3-bis-(O-geranylgeranyl)-sn-glycerol synthase